jgi:broad specificity phosphatase PhoE
MVAWSQGQLAPDDLSESWGGFRQRVADGLTQISQNKADKPLLLVTSGGVIAMIMSIVLGLDARQVVELNLQIRNSSFSQFYFNQHSMRLCSFNNVTHLDTTERLGAITYS